MTIPIGKTVLDGLPAPDSEGLVRVKATLSVANGKVTLLELNDSPIGSEDDDADPMPEEDLPNLDAAMDDIYQP